MRIIQQIAVTSQQDESTVTTRGDNVEVTPGARHDHLYALDTDGVLWFLRDPDAVQETDRAAWKQLPDLPFYTRSLK